MSAALDDALSVADMLDAKDSKAKDSKEKAPDLATVAAAQATFFHSADDTCYASIDVASHVEHYALKSKRFRTWLARLSYTMQLDRESDDLPRGCSGEQLTNAINALEAHALHTSEQHEAHTRIAAHRDAIYLDLCNESWQAVEIEARGWRIIDRPPVRFVRQTSARALSTPQHGGTLDTLRQFLDVDEHAWRMLASWLVASLRPTGPYPALVLTGEQGSGKSSAARLLASLIDPRAANLRAEPREVRDLMIAATKSWLVSFDNVSHIQSWLSDAFCRLSTGGGFGTRELYANDEETIFDAQRPLLLTAIDDVATRADFLDRCIVLTLPPVPEERRQTEAELHASFDAARPGILGALLDAVSTALRNVASTRVAALPRMADFALWSCAAAPALGWSAEDFLTSYRVHRDSAQSTMLDSIVFLEALQQLPAIWEGTATELLTALNGHATEATQRARNWPRAARTLSDALRRVAPALRSAQIDVSFQRRGHAGARCWTITRSDNARNYASVSSASSASSAHPENVLTQTAQMLTQKNGIVTPPTPSADDADAKIPASLEVDEVLEWSA